MISIYPGESRSYTIGIEHGKPGQGNFVGHLRLYEMEEWKDGRPSGRVKGNIQDVWVHHDHRSRGHARRLMEQAILLAHDRGLHKLELTSNEERLHARALYESLGFRITTDGFTLEIGEVT